MRGPKLVGYPPTGLRWAGDSSRLFFEWRRPGDDEPSTWVVARDGGAPRKLSDEERRTAPPVAGRWDTARRRVLFVDRGDIVLLDSVAGTRRQITRTTGNEANPRWARRESAVTFTRDNNLFLVPLDGGELTQLTDVQPRKRDPRETDSQKFVKAEEQKLIEHTRIEAEKKKKAEEKDKAHALPKFELADRQSATDLQLSPDGTHVFVLVVERSETAKRPNVPNYVTESSYTEDIPVRTFVGDAQDQPLAVGDEPRNRQDGRGRARRTRTQPSGRPMAPRTQRTQRTQRTDTDSAARALGHAALVRRRLDRRGARARGQQQGSLAGGRRSGDRARRACSTRSTTMRGCGKWAGSGRTIRRSAGLPTRSGSGSSPSATAGCICTPSTRRPAAGGATAHAGQVGDRFDRPVGRREEVLHHEHRGASGRAALLHDAGRRRRADEAHLDDRRHERRGLARRQHARPRLLVEHQAARGVRDAEPAGRRGACR